MIHTHSFRAMGTQILTAVDSDSIPEKVEQVPWWFEEWEQILSRFRIDSELSLVNANAGIPVQVSNEFANVFETALKVEQSSEGLVTPVLLNELILAGYDRSFEEIHAIQPPFNNSDHSVRTHSIKEIEWKSNTRTICLPTDLHLDFGGVAKGWAAQQAANRLSSEGPCLVDAGGDIAVSGPQLSGDPWVIGIANPFKPEENLELLQLEHCGVATSGIDKRQWKKGEMLQHHILDPRTGHSAETDVITATIIAKDVMTAEMATKTVLILGSNLGLEWLKKHPELSGMFVLEDGSTYYHNMEKYIWRENVN